MLLTMRTFGAASRRSPSTRSVRRVRRPSAPAAPARSAAAGGGAGSGPAVMAMTTRPRWPATARRSMAIGVRVSAVAPRSLCGSMLSPPSVPRPPRKNWTTRATRNSQATTRKALRASATARPFGAFAANEARRLLGEVMPEDEDSQAAEDVKRAQRHGIEVLVRPEGLEEDKEEKDDA